MNPLVDLSVEARLAVAGGEHPQATGKLGALITREIVLRSLRGAAAWLEASVDSAAGKGVGHRMAVYSTTGAVKWMYPHGNTGEAITCWLDLATLLDRPDYTERAKVYGYALVDDPQTGIYRGEFEPAHGLMWYWTDIGSYNSLYAMRTVLPLLRLNRLTGDGRFREIVLMMGRMFLRRQTACGLIDASWSPKRGWEEGGTRVGSRFVYGMTIFAALFQETGGSEYRDAYEKAVGALQKMQQADGSFFQNYEVATAERSPSDSSTKFLFFSYILNAIEETYEIVRDERLLDAAKRLGDYLVRVHYYRAALPYCVGTHLLPADQPEADTGIYDCANGLLWLHGVTGELRYLDVATKLWLAAWSNQPEGTGIAGLDGAIISGSTPFLSATVEGVTADRAHLLYDPSRAGKCSLWGMVNHVFACRRLLGMIEGKSE